MGKLNYSDWLIVVPARRGSERLPDKPLQDIAGKPLVVRVFLNLQPLIEKGAEVIVACDDAEVLEVCQKNNVKAVMTDTSHQSGTDRCYEVAKDKTKKFVLNVQGDEPCIDVSDLEQLMSDFVNAETDLGTLAYQSSTLEDFESANVCKLVKDSRNRALYFSRSPIPHTRGGATGTFLQHIGVYCFKMSSLEKFCRFEPSPLEKTEKLEQLRALENGLSIQVSMAQSLSHGVDTPEDLERVRALF